MEAANDKVDTTHALLAPELPRLPAGNLQALMFDCIEDGPESLIPLIEAEFGRRGLDPYANGYPANDA